MKKNITINLFGQLYSIDEDACNLLEQYLENMKSYFSKREGGDEIADDIEHRVAEIFTELKNQGHEAISIEEVENIIHRIGNPEDMDEENLSDTTDYTKSESTQQDAQNFNNTPPPHTSTFFKNRRLYRDPDDMMLGGVMSGICKYFGGSDPLPWRIIMILLAFLSLSTIGIIYLIAWGLIPVAQTAEERLKMQGRPINPQTLNDELMRTANKANNYLHSAAIQSKASGCFGTLMHILIFLFKIAGLFFVGVLLLSALFLTVILGIITFGGVAALISTNTIDWEFAEALKNSQYLTGELWIIAVATFTCLGIVLYSLIRSFIKRPTDKSLSMGTRITLTVICVLSAVTAITLGIVAGIQTEHAYDTIEYKQNIKDGFYMCQRDRKKLASNNWRVLSFENTNDSGNLYFYDDFADKGTISYFLLEKGCKPDTMRVQIERSEYFAPGRYRMESLGWSTSAGAYIYAKHKGQVVALAQLPNIGADYSGNLQTMSRDSLAQTVFFDDSLSINEWNKMQEKGFGYWGYVKSSTFDHPGGPIEYGLTNQPTQVGMTNDQPQAWKFAMHQLRIEPVKTTLVR